MIFTPAPGGQSTYCTDYNLSPSTINQNTGLSFQSELAQLGSLMTIPMKELIVDLPAPTDLEGTPAGCINAPDLSLTVYSQPCVASTYYDAHTNTELFPAQFVRPAACSLTSEIHFLARWTDQTSGTPEVSYYFTLTGGTFFSDVCQELVFEADVSMLNHLNFVWTTGYYGLFDAHSFEYATMSWTRGTDVWSVKSEVEQICGGIIYEVTNCASGISPNLFSLDSAAYTLGIDPNIASSQSTGQYSCQLDIKPQQLTGQQSSVFQSPISVDIVTRTCLDFNYVGSWAANTNPPSYPEEHYLIEYAYTPSSTGFSIQVDFLGCTGPVTVHYDDYVSRSWNATGVVGGGYFTFDQQNQTFDPLQDRIQTFTFTQGSNTLPTLTDPDTQFYETAVKTNIQNDPRINILIRPSCLLTEPLNTILTVNDPNQPDEYTFVRPYIGQSLNGQLAPTHIALNSPTVAFSSNYPNSSCQTLNGSWDLSINFQHQQSGSSQMTSVPWTGDGYEFFDQVYPGLGDYPPCTLISGFDFCTVSYTFQYTVTNTDQAQLPPITKQLHIYDGLKELIVYTFQSYNPMSTEFDSVTTFVDIIIIEPLMQEDPANVNNEEVQHFKGFKIYNNFMSRSVYLQAQDPAQQTAISFQLTTQSTYSDTVRVMPLVDYFEASFQVCFTFGNNLYYNLRNLCDTQNPITFKKCDFSSYVPETLPAVEITYFEQGTETFTPGLVSLQSLPCQTDIALSLDGGILSSYLTFDSASSQLTLSPIPESLTDSAVQIGINLEINGQQYLARTFDLTVVKPIDPPQIDPPKIDPSISTPLTEEVDLENQIQLTPRLVQGQTSYTYQLGGGVKEFQILFEQQFLEEIQQSSKTIRKLTIEMSLNPQLPQVVSFESTLLDQLTKVSVSVNTDFAALYFQSEYESEQGQTNFEIRLTFIVSDLISDPKSQLIHSVFVNFYDYQTEQTGQESFQNQETKLKDDKDKDQDSKLSSDYVNTEIAKNIWTQTQKALSFKKWDVEQDDGLQFLPQVKSVDNMGIILVDFYPPILDFEDDWTVAWDDTNFELFSADQREYVESSRKNIINVEYIQIDMDIEREKQPILIETKLSLMSPGTIQLKIDFTNPLFVSETTRPDMVRIFLNKGFFRKRSGSQIQEKVESRSDTDIDQKKTQRNLQAIQTDFEGDSQQYFVVLSEIPQQVESDESAQAQIRIANQITTGIQAQFVLSFFVSFLMKGALGFLWDLYNFMQVLAAISLFTAQIPANLTIVAEIFNKVSNFQLFDKETLYKAIWSENDQSEEDKFGDKVTKNTEKLGSGSSIKDILQYVILFVTLVIVIILLVVLRISFFNHCCGCFKIVYFKIEHKIIFNSLLRSMLTTYLSIGISIWFSISKLTLEDFYSTSSYFTLFMALLLVFLPVGTFIFLERSKDKLKDESHRNRFGSLTQNLDLDKERACSLWPTAFLSRRFLLALIIVFGAIQKSSPQFQVQTTLILCNLIGYLVFKIWPMNFWTSNVIMILNESICGLLLISILCFTNFVPSPEIKSKIGEFMLVILAIVVLLNILSTIYIQVKLAINQLRKKLHAKRNKMALLDKESSRQNTKDEKLKNFLKQKIEECNRQTENNLVNTSKRHLSQILEEEFHEEQPEQVIIKEAKFSKDRFDLSEKDPFGFYLQDSGSKSFQVTRDKELKKSNILMNQAQLRPKQSVQCHKFLIEPEYDTQSNETNERNNSQEIPSFFALQYSDIKGANTRQSLDFTRTELNGKTQEKLISLEDFGFNDIYAKFFDNEKSVTSLVPLESVKTNENKDKKLGGNYRQRDQIRPYNQQRSLDMYKSSNEITVEDRNEINIVELTNANNLDIDLQPALRRKNLSKLL